MTNKEINLKKINYISKIHFFEKKNVLEIHSIPGFTKGI